MQQETMKEYAARLAITVSVTKVRDPISCRACRGTGNGKAGSWKPCLDCGGHARRVPREGDDWRDSAREWRVSIHRDTITVGMPYWTGCGIRGIPTVEDILSCIVSDASLGDAGFEEFCDNLGMDTDSRKALASYLECQEQGAKLRTLLGSYREYQTLLNNVERL